jgi:hypothetical protein
MLSKTVSTPPSDGETGVAQLEDLQAGGIHR